MGWDWGSILGGGLGGLVGLGVGSGFLTDPSRWMTPGEHETRRRYEDIYGRLGPEGLNTKWIGEWGKEQTGAAKDAWEWALSEKMKRIAPGIAGRGMWGSPGVRGALQLEAQKPLDQALQQQLSNIQSQQWRMRGQAGQDWQNRELQKLLYQMMATGKMGELGITGSDIFSGLEGLAGSGMQAWGGMGGGG